MADGLWGVFSTEGRVLFVISSHGRGREGGRERERERERERVGGGRERERERDSRGRLVIVVQELHLFLNNTYLIYLFVCLFLAPRLAGSYLPYQGLNPGPLQWKRRVLTAGPPGNSRTAFFNKRI